MKKKISITLTLSVILTILFCTTIYANDINVYIDNEMVELTDANGERVYPFIQNGTTYVPLRGVSETLDCDVIWDGNNKTILIYKEMNSDNSIFKNWSDEIKIYVDNTLVELKDANGKVVKPFIKNGTTYVPLRGISQALNYLVEWESTSKSVYVWKDDVPPHGVTIDFLHPVEFHANKIAYESQGETIEISGEKYTNAIDMYTWYQDGEVTFDLNGKYHSLSCVFGHTSRYDLDKRVTFIVDGKIVETVELKSDSDVKPITVKLNQGLRLTIKDDDTCYFGLGNIRFFGE